MLEKLKQIRFDVTSIFLWGCWLNYQVALTLLAGWTSDLDWNCEITHLWCTASHQRGTGKRPRLWFIPSEPISRACPFLQEWIPFNWTKWDWTSLTSESLQLHWLMLTGTEDALCKQQVVHTMCDDILGVRRSDFCYCLDGISAKSFSQATLLPSFPRGWCKQPPPFESSVEGTSLNRDRRAQGRSAPLELTKWFHLRPYILLSSEFHCAEANLVLMLSLVLSVNIQFYERGKIRFENIFISNHSEELCCR